MSTDIDSFIAPTVKFGNEMYEAGFESGVIEGKRQAYAEFQKIIKDTFTWPDKERT